MITEDVHMSIMVPKYIPGQWQVDCRCVSEQSCITAAGQVLLYVIGVARNAVVGAGAPPGRRKKGDVIYKGKLQVHPQAEQEFKDFFAGRGRVRLEVGNLAVVACTAVY